MCNTDIPARKQQIADIFGINTAVRNGIRINAAGNLIRAFLAEHAGVVMHVNRPAAVRNFILKILCLLHIVLRQDIITHNAVAFTLGKSCGNDF